MTKQYRVFYKRAEAANWGLLEPGVHTALYDVPPVNEAIRVLREHPVLEAVVVRHENALLNIVTFSQAAIAPKAFLLTPRPKT